METNFAQCLAATLLEEGGYSNNPHDPGGSTYHGVTQSTYDKWRSSKGLERQDVRKMTTEECDALYHNDYWAPAFCGFLPAGVDMVHFDTAVNTGTKEAAFILQRAINAFLPAGELLGVDGAVGPATAAAAKRVPVNALLDRQTEERLEFYQRLSTWATFGKGWSERAHRVNGKAHKLAADWAGRQTTAGQSA